MSHVRWNTVWNIVLALAAVGCIYGILSYSGGEGTVKRQMTITLLEILFLLAAMGKPATRGLWTSLRHHAVAEWYAGRQEQPLDVLLLFVSLLLILSGAEQPYLLRQIVEPMPDWYVLATRTFVFACACMSAWGCFWSHHPEMGAIWCAVGLLCDPFIPVEATRHVWGKLIDGLLNVGNVQE